MDRLEKKSEQKVKKNGQGRPAKIIPDPLQRNTREIYQSRSRSRDRRQVHNSHSFNSDSGESYIQIDDLGASFSACNNTNQEFSNLLRVAFIEFFSSASYSKGLVFTFQERLKLKKEEKRKFKNDPNYKIVHWNAQSQWDKDNQVQKIDKILKKSQAGLSQQRLVTLKDVFLKTSYIFADEVTEQLYILLLTVAEIVTTTTLGELEQKIKSLMKEVREGKNFYKFLSFSFSSYFQLSIEAQKKVLIYQTLGLTLMRIFRDRL